MAATDSNKTSQRVFWIIVFVSVIILLLVTYLFQADHKKEISGFATNLPLINAAINGSCFVLLLMSLYFIKQKKIQLHKAINTTAVILSALFLVSYVIFHSYGVETKFGDLNHDGIVDEMEIARAGIWRVVYLSILLSHILLAIFVVPLVLLSLYYGYINSVHKHKKIVRFAYPVWLYETFSGVVVYLMISPYYAF